MLGDFVIVVLALSSKTVLDSFLPCHVHAFVPTSTRYTSSFSHFFQLNFPEHMLLSSSSLMAQPRSAASSTSLTTLEKSLSSLSSSIPPPPSISMPVWSLSCPNPFSDSTSMSILTFVTPVSVSSPKLWAVSLYKTSFTRNCFLGIPKRGEEFNDVAIVSSSTAQTNPLTGGSVRRAGGGVDEGMVDEARLKLGAGSLARLAQGTGGRSMGRGIRGIPDMEKEKIVAGVGILQLLSPKQSKIVSILGKTTGWDGNYSKKEECAKIKVGENGSGEWATISGSNNKEITFEVLPNCVSYIQIKLKQVTDGGDHDVAICEVIGTGVWDENEQSIAWLDEKDVGVQSALDPSSALYSGQLRTEGII